MRLVRGNKESQLRTRFKVEGSGFRVRVRLLAAAPFGGHFA